MLACRKNGVGHPTRSIQVGCCTTWHEEEGSSDCSEAFGKVEYRVQKEKWHMLCLYSTDVRHHMYRSKPHIETPVPYPASS